MESQGMLPLWRTVLIAFLFCAAAIAAEPAKFVADPEIENLIEQTASRDKAAAKTALEALIAKGDAATKQLTWHLYKESSQSASLRWAILLAQTEQGRVGYRVRLELQPEGSGNLTLISDRALLA